jgi:hypothetical protein
MSISTQTQREQAYKVRFGTGHPTRAQVLAWARELFPDIKSLRLKTVDGRTALMDNKTVLGAGADPVEAVASADIRKKQLSAKTAGITPTITRKGSIPMDPISTPQGTVDGEAVINEAIAEIPALQKQIVTLNAALAAANQAAAAGTLNTGSPELIALNQEIINLNAVLGTPIQPVPNAAPVPPVPSVPVSTPTPSSSQTTDGAVATDPAPGATSDPAALTQALS